MDDLRVMFQEVDVDFAFISEPYFADTPFGQESSLLFVDRERGYLKGCAMLSRCNSVVLRIVQYPFSIV